MIDMKRIFQSLSVGFMAAVFAGAVAATPAEEFRDLIAEGDVGAIEAMIAQTDAANVESGLTQNDTLRVLFEQFQSTHPDVRATLVKWRETAPKSFYLKSAEGWHFEHLGWIARGNSYAQNTHPLAFEQMGKLFDRSSAIAWGAFEERTDFVPASDLVAVHYLHGRGKWDMEKFAEVALTANPSASLLEKIVLAANPKWNGSWREIEYYCETYADQMVTDAFYNTDVGKPQAVFHMPATYNGGNKALLRWAREVMDSAPDEAMLHARYWDMFYLRPETITPETKDLAISLFDPLGQNARHDAYDIESRAGVVGFAKEQKDKIGAALRAQSSGDPLNPDYLNMLQYKILSQYPKALTEWGVTFGRSSEADVAFLNQMEQIAKLAPYRPDVWLTIGSVNAGQRRGNVLFERGLEHYERAVVLSNYDKKYVSEYFNRLALAHTNLKLWIKSEATMVQVSPQGEPLEGVEIDPRAMLKTLECPLVRAARLTEYACTENEQSRNMCGGAHLMKNPVDVFEEASRHSYCPKFLRTPLRNLALDVDVGL